MKNLVKFMTAIFVLFIFVVLLTAERAESFIATEHQITFASDEQTTPTLGHDAIGDYVVFTSYTPVVNGCAQSDIYYQRLLDGQPVGNPVAVAATLADERVSDASGDYIVYTRYESVTSTAGKIILYRISTGETLELDSSADSYFPKIAGDVVVWLKMTNTGNLLLMYKISTGVPVQTAVLVGPVPNPKDIEVGERLVAWTQFVNGQYDVEAYDLLNGYNILVAGDWTLNERMPTTGGPWVAYQVSASMSPSVIAIYAGSIDTFNTRVVVDNGATNANPNISGHLLSYESNLTGDWQIYVYRFAEGDTFQVTSGPYDHRLNDINGDLVTYVDARNGNLDVFVAKLTFNNPPIADAGPNQTVHAGNLVTLDGSGSSDPGGFVPLTYAWSFSSKPAGSAAVLSNPTAVNPTFTADLTGNYVVQLVVSDIVGVASMPATVTISTTNTAPVASAGPDQAVTLINSIIHLDGSQSYDPDGDAITYEWSFISIPGGSAATLSDPNIVNPTFIADVHGTYVAQLVVRDPWSQSAPAMVTISFQNVKPVANAGTSQSANVGDTVTLNGSGSSDANGDPLTYQWSFASVPAGSASSISSPTSMATSFIPDLQGAYVVQLIVNDGFVNSDPGAVQVQVVTAATAAVQATKALQDIIASLNPALLKNANMQNAIINKLNAVLANIATGNYASALDQLQNDILGKTDGCATTGAPDKNDWIKTCNEQSEVYPYVMNLIQLVQNIR